MRGQQRLGRCPRVGTRSAVILTAADRAPHDSGEGSLV
ncbi:hypothetical protein FHX46_003369 [Amycolatopsis viridis]|uniref:Uncharacterized protein n=1 Tax=Amycolatopsis viridis TaxID=185678 RepID=A0ABX0SV36_9PSEU|nr:hypothetical protein [Amycolatopsis viridis]